MPFLYWKIILNVLQVKKFLFLESKMVPFSRLGAARVDILCARLISIFRPGTEALSIGWETHNERKYFCELRYKLDTKFVV